MAESKLNSEQQIFIIEQLAMFERPKSVQTKLKELYDVEIARQSILHYDISNKKLSKEFKKHFNATRKKFLVKTSSIPIASKSFRLQKLQNIFEKQEDEKLQNTVEMRATLEQAAKEVGDVFTNKQKIEEKGEFRHTVVRVPAKDTPEKWLQQSKQ